MLLNSKFELAEINRERGVIIEEIKMYHENPLMHIETLFEMAVHSGNPLGLDTAGPVSVIRNVTREQLVGYRDHYYQPGNLVVAIAGRLDAKLKSLLESKFINKLKKDKPVKPFIPFVSKQIEPRVVIENRKTKQVQLALGFPTFGYENTGIYALHLLSIILGGNMSSRLFVSVRERRGLAYFIRCSPNYYQDAGNFMIQSGLDVTRIDEAIKVIVAELARVKRFGVTDKELHDAKEFVRGKTILSLEDSSHLAEYFAKQELLMGRIETLEVKMKKYDAVTLAEIKKLAKEIFVKEKFNMALIGPFNNQSRFKKLIKL